MNTNKLGLSGTSTRQLDRVIDDAAWLTYPFHLFVGLIKTFVFTALCILAVFISIAVWLMSAHDNRAEWTKNFVAEQSIYRVNFVNKEVADRPVVVNQGSQFSNSDKAQLVWECPDTSKDLKKRTWGLIGDNWLEEKSDAFQSAYIAASCNMVGLTERLEEAKGDFGHYPNMPNAPVVLVSFLERTDYERTVPADFQGNWYAGMCLASAKCTDADFVPRNTSIFYDLFAPQMTANQDAAVKALYVTSTPEFWVAAAHANGIYDKDAAFASYAVAEQADLAKKLRHRESSSDEFAHEVEIGIGLYVAFVVLICACQTRAPKQRCLSCGKTYRQGTFTESPRWPNNCESCTEINTSGQFCSCCGELFNTRNLGKDDPLRCGKCKPAVAMCTTPDTKNCPKCAKYFPVLRLNADAGEKEAKSAYRNFAKIYHPDRFEGKSEQQTAAEELKQINESYSHIRKHFEVERC